MDEEVDQLARTLLEYMRLNQEPQKSDVIIGMGALDTRIAERSAQLYLDGYGQHIVFTGGLGKVTSTMQTETEAEIFSAIALRMGVLKDAVLVEKEATNSGENIRFTKQLLDREGLHPKSLLIVTKPYMERRIYAAYKKQWPDPEVAISVTSPQISYEEHFSTGIPKDLFINVMVGDLQRIREYPKLGYQIEQEVPPEVWKAYARLVELGYSQYLMDNVPKEHHSSIEPDSPKN